MKNSDEILFVRLIPACLGWGAQITGTELGPNKLIEAGLSELLQQAKIDNDWDQVIEPSIRASERISLDYPQRLEQIRQVNEKIAIATKESLMENEFPVVLGGDHSIAIGTWSGVTQAMHAQENFGLIWIDAHMDANTPDTTPSNAIHGMPLAVLLGRGEQSLVNLMEQQPKLSPEHVVLIGIRSYEHGEAKFLKDIGVKIYYMDEVFERGFQTIFKEAKEIVTKNTKGYGITLDLDGFDAAEVPGVGSPEGNGLMVKDVCEAVKGEGFDNRLKAVEIAEFNPELDEGDRTFFAIRDILISVFSSE